MNGGRDATEKPLVTEKHVHIQMQILNFMLFLINIVK